MKHTHMNIRKNIILAFVIFIGFFSLVKSSEANITLTNGVWTSTFNCSWTQNTSKATTICDGIVNNNYLNGCNPYSQTASAANNPNGGGGNGFEQYICAGTNIQSGSPDIILPSPVPEFWFRWYQKYPPGLTFKSGAGYQKLFYFDNFSALIETVYGAQLVIDDLVHNVNYYPSTQIGMSVIGDGNWHFIEVHCKVDTNGSNGIFQIWIDGVLNQSVTNFNWSGTDFSSWSMVINQATVATPGWMYIDDLEVSTVTPPNKDAQGNAMIGPVSGGGSTVPTVAITSPTSNPTYSTSSSTVAVTGTASDNVAVSSVKWACPTCTPTSGTATGTTSWSVSSIGLASGSNAITVTATDSSNNTGTKALTVTSTSSVVNGACGTISGQSNTSLTSSSPNLCATGSVASFTGTGPWTWGCNGSGGGTNTASNACSSPLSSATLLFSEDFEDSNYLSRGWYDGTFFDLVSSEHESGSQSAAFPFAQGATSWTGSTGAMRKEFTATDSLYVSFYIKFATGWEGSQKAYHPHIISILSDVDDAANKWSPLANNYMNTYIEFLSDIGSPYAIRPQLNLQDELNVNTSNGTPPNNLTAVTENRSVNYCNTPVSAGAAGQCYADVTYYSMDSWKAASSSVSTNAWHHVEAYFKMNSISGGKGQNNGIMQEWIDGTQVINHSDVLYRTNQHPTMKWAQFVFAPYIGDGAPVAETFYIDNLQVYNGLASGSSVNPVSGVSVKSTTNP